MRKILVGNWKMNPESVKEARVIFNDIAKRVKGFKKIDIIICPPFPFLFINNELKNKSIHLGSQDVFTETKGAYTGEISSKMLTSLGVKYVILGHSERRALGDTDQIINKKILAVLKEKLIPILCIGEKTRDSNGFYLAFIKHQLVECLFKVPKSQIKNIVIAYEPIWAIGDKSKNEATKDEFIEIQIFIKKIIADIYNIKIASIVKIIYGGSVHSSNAKEFIESGADGLLVGRDSIIPKKFEEIINVIK